MLQVISVLQNTVPIFTFVYLISFTQIHLNSGAQLTSVIEFLFLDLNDCPKSH